MQFYLTRVYNSETIYESDRNRARVLCETIYLHISLFGICCRPWTKFRERKLARIRGL